MRVTLALNELNKSHYKHVVILFEVQKEYKNVDLKVLKTKGGRTMLLSERAVCSSKKLRFMKEQASSKKNIKQFRS